MNTAKHKYQHHQTTVTNVITLPVPSSRQNTESTDMTAFDKLCCYRPYMLRLMKKKEDAEDLEQEICIKLVRNYNEKPDWWDNINNKNAYMFTIVTHSALDMRRRLSRMVGLDDSELNRTEGVSDEGRFEDELHTNIDQEKFRRRLRDLMKDFSPYERRLVWLNYFEGCKPMQVAGMLKNSYPDKDPKVICSDCNTAKAKFIARLKVFLKKYR